MTHAIKTTSRILMAALLMMAATGCERRSLIEIDDEINNNDNNGEQGGSGEAILPGYAIPVELTVDWSEFNEPVPDNMTVVFYPQDGEEPIILPWDEVETVTTVITTLPCGSIYDVWVYNKSAEDFDCYDFTGLPQRIATVDGKRLEPLGVATTVMDVQCPLGTSDEDVPDYSTVVYPHNIVWTCNVIVGVSGYDFVKNVSGKLTGLSGSYTMDGYEPTIIDQTLDNWKGFDSEQSYATTFQCLGLPYTHTASADENHLLLDMSLIKNETVNRDIPVGNIIEVDSKTNTMTINVNTVASEVSGGYEVEVDPWETEAMKSNKRIRRAHISDINNVQADGFRFTTIWRGRPLYSNATAEWDGTEYVTNPHIYWPAATENAPCTFNAISYPNADGNPIEMADGKLSFNYTTAATATEQQDVLVAYTQANDVPEDGIQKLCFTHALTKVNFTVYVENKEENRDYTWQVTSIKLNAKTAGTYTFGAETPWTLAEGENTELEYLNSPDQMQPLENGGKWDGYNNFMLIPQAGEDLTVTVAWSVYTQNGSVKVSKSEAERSYTISTADWKPNASLRYASLRLPNIGEKTDGGNDSTTDDNNMSIITYEPDCR